MLVFEVRGSIQSFINAVRKVQGLEFIDEEELDKDDQDNSPAVYLLVPDERALREIVSLWGQWSNGEALRTGFTPWRDVFATLRNIRPWGPNDRVQAGERQVISTEIAFMADDERIRLEIELVFRLLDERARDAELNVINSIRALGGSVVSSCRIADIGYHAILAELPVLAARSIVELSQDSIAGFDSVMHIRPQSISTTIEVGDSEATVLLEQSIVDRPPILAVLDGVPVAQHPLLNGGLIVDDQFGLESLALVGDREHGTAIASLIMHGDRNRSEQRLTRRLHFVPVLGQRDEFPNDRLIVDMIYQAVLTMRGGDTPTAPDVLIVNLSLGNSRSPFHGRMSPWARLIDRLSYRFGILFIISAGNHKASFDVPNFSSFSQFEDATETQRAQGTMSAVGRLMAERRLLSPSESVNGVTVGAANLDGVSSNDRQATPNVDPFPNLTTSNPSSALGPGFAKSVKPDILMPGAKEHVSFVATGIVPSIRPSGAARAHGLKVASPPRNGVGNLEHYTSGTSAAAALASRTCHQIHDALEVAYGDIFKNLGHAQRAAILKALLVHTATWSQATADLIKQTLGPFDNRKHVLQKDNIRRFLGYGVVDSEAAVACAEDRATFWASGTLPRERTVTVQVPIPVCINGQARPHTLQATLAWFTPVLVGRQSYRVVRLKLLDSDELSSLRVDLAKTQPDHKQVHRGTVVSRRWAGERAPIIGENHFVTLTIQREPDLGSVIDEPIAFALAVTLAMPGITQIYDQVRTRLAVPSRIDVR